MKQTLLTLFLLISIGLSQEYNLDELVERDGMYFEKYSDKPLRGKVYTMFGNKKVIMGKLVNGKFNGKWIYWYENGQIKREGRYRNGLMNGEWTYYHENGQIREQGRFIDGDGNTPDGVYPDWMADSLISILPPFDGRSGQWTYWDGDGQKRSEGTYKDGKWDGLLTEWYETGQKERETTYKDGEYDGLYTGWYDNGQKFWEDTYKDGELISSKCWDVNGIDIDCP